MKHPSDINRKLYKGIYKTYINSWK